LNNENCTVLRGLVENAERQKLHGEKIKGDELVELEED
jgi:hypothetical protein